VVNFTHLHLDFPNGSFREVFLAKSKTNRKFGDSVWVNADKNSCSKCDIEIQNERKEVNVTMEIKWGEAGLCEGYCGFWKQDCVTREREREITYGRSRIESEYEMKNNKGKRVPAPNEQKKSPFRLFACSVFCWKSEQKISRTEVETRDFKCAQWRWNLIWILRVKGCKFNSSEDFYLLGYNSALSGEIQPWHFAGKYYFRPELPGFRTLSMVRNYK
jgi:hypothetical protein